MKVFIVGGGGNYAQMFINHGWEVIGNIFNADLVQFTGGEDVTPEIYGEENTSSYNNFERDLREAGIFAIAQRMGKPMAGICRGGQFLNVMCGGSMIQHVEGHAIHGTHPLVSMEDIHEDIPTINVTSTHHQAMVSDGHGDILDVGPDGIVEVINYTTEKVLCFQPHPEFTECEECTDYYFELLDRCLGLKV